MNSENILRCPVCQQTLQREDRQWSCENNHRYDIARQGYCNLLLANQKKSASPGDDKAMLVARQHFLNAGHYQPIADSLMELVNEFSVAPTQLLDIGCGEGYYLAQLKSSMSSRCNFYGTDISRDAIKLAAANYKQMNWFVAAARNQPFLDHSLDLVLNIFAPADWSEIHRLLKPGGRVILAVAGEDHLQALRELLYSEVKPHRPSRFLDKIAPQFETIASKSCQFRLQLCDNSAIRSLLQMTPYYWQASPALREQVENLQELDTPVNVQFFVLQARSSLRSETNKDL